MTTTTNKLTRAAGTIASATGGRKSWDPSILMAAAESCLRGESAHDFEGRPDGHDEFRAFERAWKRVQNR